jgi:hypothetical protein
MWKINIQDDLRIRFPARDKVFAEGVEIGMLATLMSLGWKEFERTISKVNLDQARSLGEKLGYHLAGVEDDTDPSFLRITFRDRKQRAKLKLVI